MITTDQAQELLGSGGAVVGDDGSTIGKIGQLYLDDKTGEPEWVTVKTGMFGSSESFVPLAQGTVEGNEVRVPFGKDKVTNAPRMDADGHISEEEEADLYRYYGLGETTTPETTTPETTTPETTTPEATDRRDRSGEMGVVGRDTSGPTTDDAMTRSEEQVRVGTETRETGKARLRKYVVTENVTTTVPVSHEEVRVEREPITDANRGDALAGGDITEEEHEVTLHEERPVVQKETVPVERVRLDTETVTETTQVSEDVRKEQIDVDAGTQEQSRR